MNKPTDIIKSNHNYIIIGVLSFVAVFFLPMLGSSVGLAFNIPNSPAGWVIYLITKISIVVINIMIFDQFVKRAKINVKDNEKFKFAESILIEKVDEEEVLAPEMYLKKMYRSKLLTTVIFTVLGVFGFTNAILTFDWVSMLSYIFTIVMGLIFGWIAMVDAEEIWTNKYYRFAKKIQLEKSKEESHD